MRAVLIAAWWLWGYAGCGLLPVWRQGRRGWSGVATGVLASFAILFSSALGLQLAGRPLSLEWWALTTVIFSLGLCGLPRGAVPRKSFSASAHAGDTWAWRACAVPLIAAGAVILFRAVGQPLVGFDTALRWDFLAHQIVKLHSLDFYPAFTDADFTHFMWPDGIPPLVSLLYAWSYLGVGSLAPAATAPVVLVVAVLVFGWVWHLAIAAQGPRAGAWAVGLLATSALHTWSISNGQETALMTAGILAVMAGLNEGSDEPPDWLLVGLGAGIAALSRDYGLAAALAAVILFWKRTSSVATTLRLILLGAALVLPWYLRNQWRTGNPLYNQDVLGIFPTNQVHLGLMHFFRDRFSFFASSRAEQWAQVKACLGGLGVALPLLGGLAFRNRVAWKSGAPYLVILWIGLCAWSIGYTAGGFGYALRVLSPALALLAVVGGVALARLVSKRWRFAVTTALSLLALDASLRALVMMASPWEIAPTHWLDRGAEFSAFHADASFDEIGHRVGSDRVLVDNSYHFSFLTERGISAVPVWTPEVAFLFDEHVDWEAAVSRLRATGIRYVLRSAAPDMQMYFNLHAFFRLREPWLTPRLSGNGWILFELPSTASIAP